MCYSSLVCFCQNSNLEFVENKGQWENGIKFKGVMNNGAFFLQEKGFMVVQHKAEDLEQLAELMHGVKPQSENVTKKVNNAHDNKVTVRSHAYTVQFLNASIPVIRGDK